MRRFGIICASETELSPFLKLIDSRHDTRRAGLAFHEGYISRKAVIAVYSGVGKVNAAIAAELMIERFSPDALISAGTAGAIREGVLTFDTVIADRVAYHDLDGDILTGYHPWMSDIYFYSDKGLIDIARKLVSNADDRIRIGSIVSGDLFAENEQRAIIDSRFSPLAIDMESAAIAHACYVNGTGFLSVRTITDTYDESGIESFERNEEKASAISASITEKIISHS